MKKVRIKRYLPAICILIIVIIIIAIVFGLKNRNVEETNQNSQLNTGSVEEGTQSSETSQEDGGNSTENNENTLDVPQLDTSSTNEYVDESGAQIENATVEQIQEKIKEKFKTISKTDLKLEGVDLETARFIFSEGVMNIAKKDCFGFSIYVLKGEYLVNAGMYAMSLDTEVLYRYDTDTLTYIFVPMN